jgi:hypothetical protein
MQTHWKGKCSHGTVTFMFQNISSWNHIPEFIYCRLKSSINMKKFSLLLKAKLCFTIVNTIFCLQNPPTGQFVSFWLVPRTLIFHSKKYILKCWKLLLNYKKKKDPYLEASSSAFQSMIDVTIVNSLCSKKGAGHCIQLKNNKAL